MTRGIFLRLLAMQAVPRRKPARAMHPSVPLEIRLAVTAGPSLHASLANLSSGPLMVLHERNLQPSQPMLATPAGAEVPFVDGRRKEKFDRTPYRELYRKLEGGGELLLWEEKFQWEDESYHFRWGPFQALGIAPGNYAAGVRWRSAITEWVDSETRQTGKWKEIWLGELTSIRVQVELPKP